MTAQDANAEMKSTVDGHRYPCFLSYHILNIQCTSVQQYSFTLRHRNTITIHFITNIHFTSPLAPPRSNVPRTLPGGWGVGFRSQSLQVFAATHGATRSHDQPAPPNDQSSLRTSSQISSIKRRYAMSMMSNAIYRSSLSVGIRPAPKTGS
jgi:hypothetical protein